MGLLRAFADAVLLGAGTLRATPGHHWTAEHIFPSLAAQFAELRRRLGRAPQPRLVVMTNRGDVDPLHPALVDGATIVTTPRGADVLRGKLPASCDVLEAGQSAAVDIGEVVDGLRGRGYNLVLTEGGPHVMGQLISRSLLDELFLTVSPVVAGRDREQRLGMVAGAELLPDRAVWSRLLSVRRHGEFLFLRYRLTRPG